MRLCPSVALLALSLWLPAAFAQQGAPKAPTAKALPRAKAPPAIQPKDTATQDPAPKDAPKGPAQVEHPCPACAACPEADRAYATAIGFAFEPAPEEIRALAVEDLGLLGDPRALNPLASLVLDPNPAIRSAAIRAIRTFTLPRAEEILANVVRHGHLDEGLKLQALEALLFQRTTNARLLLESIRDDRDNRYGPRLQEAARTLAARWNPTYRR